MKVPNINRTGVHSKSIAAIGLALVALVTASVAAEETGHQPSAKAERVISFAIQPKALVDALNEFIAASDWQVGFPAALAKDILSPGVSGNYSAEQALARLLQGSGVSYRLTGKRMVTLEKSVLPSDKKATLGTVMVSAQVAAEASSGYSIFKSSAATKTNTPIMEAPMSIQVVPREVIADQKATNIRETLENVSGVRSQPSLGVGATYVIRGFPNGNVYRNGLRTNGLPMDYDTSSLESVEVIKGPAQLYGRIEPGGLINLTTKKPLDTPYYSLEQRFGSYDFYRTEWDASGPITNDKSLLYRFTGSYQNNQSFRDFAFSDKVVVSPSILWRPTDATDFYANIEAADGDWRADYGIPVIGKRPVNIPISRSLSDPDAPAAYTHKILLNTELNHRFNDDWAIHNRFLANWDHGVNTFINPAPAFNAAAAFNQQTGIMQRNIFQQFSEQERYATNLDLTGKFQIGRSKHDILLGFDYYQGHNRYGAQGYWIAPNPALAIDIYNPRASYGIPRSVYDTAFLSSSRAGLDHSVIYEEWKGVYFQDQITLWDKLHITGGGRYDWAENGRGNARNFTAAENLLNHASPSIIAKVDGFSPRVGILYEPWKQLSLYGNWTTSFGASNGISATGATFKPQVGEQFETGIKTALFDQRLLATLAYFHLTKENLLTPDLTSGIPGAQVAIGQQRSQGIELDVTGHVTDHVSLIGSYAFTDARITVDNRTLNGRVGGYVGKRLNNVPEQSSSLWLRYDVNGHEAKEGASFGLGGVLAGQREGDVANTFQMPGYVRMDAFAAYKVKVGPTRVTTQFNIRNLLDKRYYESTDPNANVDPRLGVYPGAPLTAMGSVRVEF